jgi:fatty acid desaturase
MQLEDLQRQWNSLDEKLDRTLKLDAELLRLAVVQPARRRLHRLAIWPAIDVAFCLVILLGTGAFLETHWRTWSLIGPATVLMIAAIVLLVESVRQIERISKIDWGGTVVEIQSSLSKLGIAKIRQFKWIMLLSPLIGFCAVIVGLQWLLDLLPQPHFILDKLNGRWVISNYVFGVLFIPVCLVVVRFLSNRFRGRSWWQRMLEDISGSSMQRTRDELSRWASLDKGSMEMDGSPASE